MKTEQEQTKQMLKTLCDKFQCSAIDRSYMAKSCRQCEDIIEALHEAGYGDVSEYKAEIERLKTENEILKTNLRKLEEKCAEFDKLCYDYNKSLYTMRCNMTSVTRYVRNENEAYNARYKELAEKAVENILKTINHKGEE